MFIREYKQTNKETGEVYIKHKLVASVRTKNGPRQKIIMPLGTLTIPRIDWKRLAHALECRITGQQSLLEAHDSDLEQLALKIISNNSLSKSLEIRDTKNPKNQDKEPNTQNENRYIPIDINSVTLKSTRSLGGELLCMKAWEILGFADILNKLNFSKTSISVAMVLLFGRMISPGSERHTIEWFRKRSALQEMEGVSDLSKCSKDRYYNTADELYAQKDKIEDMLFQKERENFPHTENTIYLYDITNTYIEGHGLNNTLAARGHCKSKRYDCPLITLSLIVDNEGMPICSQIYKGNQSEPETMEKIMERLTTRMYGSQIPLFKPTVVMDRGIATDKNIKWLRKNGYHYIVIKREDDSEEYRQIFEDNRDTFKITSSKKSIYHDENNVYIRKEPAISWFSDDENPLDDQTPTTTAITHGSVCRVLCISEGKARKEEAIALQKKNNIFIDDINRLQESIRKGTIKNANKISNKLHRIIGKHGKQATGYDIMLDKSGGKITGITLTKKTEDIKPLFGCYVIESTHTDMTVDEIWKLYMTLTRVESAFRSMKETLGMRPVYHQTADRTGAHLFITVLAYHMLATIENFLAKQGDTRTWGTIRDVMSTLMRGTVTMRDDKNVTYNLRLSGEPEDVHQDILDKLGVKDLPRVITSVINTL